MDRWTHPEGERGAALLLALITAALVTAVAASLVISTSADLMISSSYRSSFEAMYAVEAGVERVIGELAAIPDWGAVLAAPPSNLLASFDDGMGMARAPDGRTLQVAALTKARQALSAVAYGPAAFGADRPEWRLFGHASLHRVLPPGAIAQPAYVLIWVADDGGDGDGDPTRDANGQVLIHGEAYGLAGAQRSIEAAIARASPGAIRLLSWKDPR